MSTQTPEVTSPNSTSTGTPSTGTPSTGLPIGNVQDILARAPLDCVEDVLAVPEWACSLRVRSLSARQVAHVKEIGMKFAKNGASIVHTEMEKAQFLAGVIEPAFSEAEVGRLFNTAGGGGWARVIDWLDEHSGTSEEERRKAAEAFQGS